MIAARLADISWLDVETNTRFSRRCVCPTCHQSVKHMVLGVAFPPKKAAILEMIKRAGTYGITTREIFERFGAKGARTTINAHIYHINEMLAATNWRLQANHKGKSARYRLINRLPSMYLMQKRRSMGDETERNTGVQQGVEKGGRA